MLSKDLVKYIASNINIYENSEALEISTWLVEYFYGISRNDLILNRPIDEAKEVDLETLLGRINTAEPIQYITREAYFYGLKFFVNPSVLIPRPETEELVELVLKHCIKTVSPQILDIGTGSGCIAVSVARKRPDASVTAWDISKKALDVAQRNAESNGVSIKFEEVDILQNRVEAFFDIVVSNPPYIKNNEATAMRANVLGFEPHLALFVENDNPLIFYKAIAAFCAKNLRSRGQFFVEINETLGEETSQIFKEKGLLSLEIIKDMYGKDRFIRGKKA